MKTIVRLRIIIQLLRNIKCLMREYIYIHEYFDRKSADWNIMGFLDECTEKSYQLKLGLYIKSLENIGSRKKKAQLLYDKYKKASKVLLYI